MKLPSLALPAALGLFLFASPATLGADSGPGEFALRSVTPLDAAALARLRASTAAPEQIARLRAEAAPALENPPAPLATIAYEGRLNTDPERIATVARLRVLDAVAAALQLWQATGEHALAATLREHVLAWAHVYHPTGNDVNENKLVPLFVAALALRDTDAFTPEDRAVLDPWFSRLGVLHAAGLAKQTSPDNRRAKRLRLLALFAAWTGESVWRESALAGFKDLVARGLHADGGSHDLELRDALSYHVSALESALELLHSLDTSAASADSPAALYAWESPSGSSLRRSVHFVVPYALGEKTRTQWTRSKIALDRERAAAGIAEYQPGRAYRGPDALPMLELAAAFDPELAPVIARLRATPQPASP